MPPQPPQGLFLCPWGSDVGSLLRPTQSDNQALYLQDLLSRELKELCHQVAGAVKPVLWKEKSSPRRER